MRPAQLSLHGPGRVVIFGRYLFSSQGFAAYRSFWCTSLVSPARFFAQPDACYDSSHISSNPAMEPIETRVKVFRFGLFELDVAQNALTRNGVRVRIHDQPLRVL